jgi:hypothetical protein
MSVFTHRVQKTIAIPGTPFDAVIRKLNPKHLEAAAMAEQIKVFTMPDAVGGAVKFKELKKLFELTPEERAEVAARKAASPAPDAPADPLEGYDRVTLVDKGLVSWTADEPIETPAQKRAAIEELDEETLDTLAREVLKLARPKLFLTADEAAADTKNGGGRCTGRARATGRRRFRWRTGSGGCVKNSRACRPTRCASGSTPIAGR